MGYILYRNIVWYRFRIMEKRIFKLATVGEALALWAAICGKCQSACVVKGSITLTITESGQVKPRE